MIRAACLSLCRSITLSVCAITKGQTTALLLTHEHRVRFDFEMDVHLPTDIHGHPLDRAGERPELLARIVPRIKKIGSYFSNTSFQSFLMLTTVHPYSWASSNDFSAPAT